MAETYSLRPLPHGGLVIDIERRAVGVGQLDEVAAAHLHVAGGVDPVRDREEQPGRLVRAGAAEPHEPPQHPPPPPLVSAPPKSIVSSGPPATAKLETSTRVLVDSHDGQTCALSRSANR